MMVTLHCFDFSFSARLNHFNFQNRSFSRHYFFFLLIAIFSYECFIFTLFLRHSLINRPGTMFFIYWISLDNKWILSLYYYSSEGWRIWFWFILRLRMKQSGHNKKSQLILLLSCGQLSHSELKPTVYNTIIMSSNRQQVRTARPWNAGNPTQPPLPCPTPFTFNSAPGLFGFVTRWHCKVANLMGTRFRIVVRIYFFWILILLKIFSSYLMI